MSSTKLILNLISSFLKIVFIFILKRFKGEMEERVRYHQKLENLKLILDKISNNHLESTNESDYISNLNWEQLERFNTYSSITLDILNSGGGITELKKVKKLGMHPRVLRKEVSIIEIIYSDISNEEKSKLIAQELVKNE
jgi:hypothetical protein